MVLDDRRVNTALTECRCNVELLRQDINEFLTDTIILVSQKIRHNQLLVFKESFKDPFFMFNHQEKVWLII